MSTDVENTLISIVEASGKKNKEDAIAFVEQLKEDGRYLRDVY